MHYTASCPHHAQSNKRRVTERNIIVITITTIGRYHNGHELPLPQLILKRYARPSSYPYPYPAPTPSLPLPLPYPTHILNPSANPKPLPLNRNLTPITRCHLEDFRQHEQAATGEGGLLLLGHLQQALGKGRHSLGRHIRLHGLEDQAQEHGRLA